MPRNQFQRMILALITVVIAVHAYVFYSLYVIHGDMFMSLTSASGVLDAIKKWVVFPYLVCLFRFGQLCLLSLYRPSHLKTLKEEMTV